MNDSDTKIFDSDEFNNKYISDVIRDVSEILEERGYDPINQIVGYLISGDPGYISNHKEARNKIIEFDRAKLLEVLLENFLNK